MLPDSSSLQGQPHKILQSIERFQKIKTKERKARGEQGYEPTKIWRGIIGSNCEGDAVKEFWAPCLANGSLKASDGEGDEEARKRIIRKIAGVLKLAREEHRKIAEDEKEEANSSKFSARSNYDEFADEEEDMMSSGIVKDGKDDSTNNDGQDDDDEFDF